MGKAARQTARERLAAERRREQERQRRVRRMAIVAGALAVVVIVVVVGIVIQSQRNKDKGYAGQLAPVSQQADGTVVMARPGVSSPVLDIYEDFQCPICRDFERLDGATVKELAAQGKAKVVYHPIAFVNPVGSLRAAAAAQCVPSDRWLAFHDRLYANQPDERTAFTVSEILSYAKDAGVTGSQFSQCVQQQTHAAAVRQRTQAAFQGGVKGTPTVVLNGRELDLNALMISPDNLRKAVLSAAQGNSG